MKLKYEIGDKYEVVYKYYGMNLTGFFIGDGKWVFRYPELTRFGEYSQKYNYIYQDYIDFKIDENKNVDQQFKSQSKMLEEKLKEKLNIDKKRLLIEMVFNKIVVIDK
jgi:hypothetical protein